jgi:hypothetical protein
MEKPALDVAPTKRGGVTARRGVTLHCATGRRGHPTPARALSPKVGLFTFCSAAAAASNFFFLGAAACIAIIVVDVVAAVVSLAVAASLSTVWRA